MPIQGPRPGSPTPASTSHTDVSGDATTATTTEPRSTTPATPASPAAPTGNTFETNTTGPSSVTTAPTNPGSETPASTGTGTLSDLMLGRTGAPAEAVAPGDVRAADGSPMAVAIPDALSDIIHTTADMNVDALQEDFGKPGPLAIRDGSDVFQTNTFVDLGMMLGQAGLPAGSKLVEVLSKPENAIHLKTGQKQFSLPELDGAKGNRIIAYGGDSGHDNIATMIHEMKDKGRFLKNMNHPEYIGGLKPSDHFEGEGAQHGVTHGGAFIPTTSADGEEEIGWLDWPANYGKMSSDDYWAQASFFSLDQVDFGKGEGLTPELKSEYYKNMDRLAVMQLMTVGFASDDINPDNRSYKSNPLEIKEAGDLKPYLDMVLSNDVESLRAYSQYCQEGVWNNINAGLNVPMNQASVDAGLISQDAFNNLKEMVDIFNAGGGLDDPSKGYEALKDAGKISDKQLGKLKQTGMDRVPLDLAPEELKPWTEYEPEGVTKEGDGAGLFGKPFTLGGLITGLVKTNFPREEMMGEMFEKLQEVANSNDPQIQAELGGVLHQMGLSPDGSVTPEALQKLSYGLSAKFQAGVLGAEQTRDMILDKLKVNKMDDASKAAVIGFYEEVVKTVGDATLTPEQIGEKLAEFDDRMRNMKVSIDGEEKGFMQFMPPHGITYMLQGKGQAVGLSYFGDLVHENYINEN